MSDSLPMRIHTLRYASGDDFLHFCRDLDGTGGVVISTRAQFEPFEKFIFDVRFPPMGNGVLIKAEAAQVDPADQTVLARLSPGERSKWDFLLGLAAATLSPPSRRRYLRFPVDLPVVWQVRGTELRQDGRAVDLSRGGIYVLTDLPPPRGTELKLTVRLPSDGEQLRLYGRVARVQQSRRGGGMGIRLRYRTTSNMRKLRKVLRTWNDTGELTAIPEPAAPGPRENAHVQI